VFAFIFLTKELIKPVSEASCDGFSDICHQKFVRKPPEAIKEKENVAIPKEIAVQLVRDGLQAFAHVPLIPLNRCLNLDGGRGDGLPLRGTGVIGVPESVPFVKFVERVNAVAGLVFQG
jgi:hypothetical protein